MQTVIEPTAAPWPAEPTIQEVLASGGVRTVFQPIVEIVTGRVVGHEALSRGPVGTTLETPDRLFGEARAAGLLAELDEVCRGTALRTAGELGLVAPTTVFVNVEPEVLDHAPLERLRAIADGTPGHLRVALEITERALSARPAELMRTVDRVRELGWAVALDDVGADPSSLLFMAMLRPDVVKLDLSLVQRRPGPETAEIMSAVHAYAERSGAVVLAEGIETEEHLAAARALGATLAQGWYFGRPTPTPARSGPAYGPVLPSQTRTPGASAPRSPFDARPTGSVVRRARKRYLIELSKHLEREAMRLGPTCLVASTFQHAQHVTPAAAARYRALAERVGFVCALGEDLPPAPAPGVRGATLAPGDPVRREWHVVVLGAHSGAALLARDLGGSAGGTDRASGSVDDLDREFEYVLTYDREAVTRAARSLLLRVPERRAPAHVR